MSIHELQINLAALGDIDAKIPTPNPQKQVNLDGARSLVEVACLIPGFESLGEAIKRNPLYANTPSGAWINMAQEQHFGNLRNLVTQLVLQLKILRTFAEASQAKTVKETDVFVRLTKVPDLPSFTDQINKIQMILEQTILDPKINGRMEVKGVEQGSIIIQLSLGAVDAVIFLGGLAWAAAVVFKKYQESRLFQAHADALEIKNDSLEDIRNAQKKLLDNVLLSEARHLDKEIYKDEGDPERLERVKYSIELFQSLIEKGAEVHPALMAPESVKNLFPDFKKLGAVESKIKQITERATPQSADGGKANGD